jgi:hypothetical protein
MKRLCYGTAGLLGTIAAAALEQQIQTQRAAAAGENRFLTRSWYR